SISCTETVYFCHALFIDPAISVIYTLSLHDALPIYATTFASYADAVPDDFRFLVKGDRLLSDPEAESSVGPRFLDPEHAAIAVVDRKSTRLNSSHVKISYAVFCLKKKRKWQLAEILY